MPMKGNSCEEIADDKSRSYWNKFWGFLFNLTSSESSRLKASIAALREELNIMGKYEGPRSSSATSACNMLDKAQQAVNRNDFELGWRYFSTARNISLMGLEEGERKAVAEDILEEANEKLSSWRKKAIHNRLCERNEIKASISRKDLFHASRILQEHHGNKYFKIGVLKKHLRILVIIAIFAMVVLFFLAPYLRLGDVNIRINDREIFLSILSFGVLGATISGILSARGGIDAKIPDQKIIYTIMSAKIVVGAASALVISVFITSGLFNIPSKDGITLGIILAVAFAAGFTERLVTRAVDSVIQSDSKK